MALGAFHSLDAFGLGFGCFFFQCGLLLFVHFRFCDRADIDAVGFDYARDVVNQAAALATATGDEVRALGVNDFLELMQGELERQRRAELCREQARECVHPLRVGDVFGVQEYLDRSFVAIFQLDMVDGDVKRRVYGRRLDLVCCTQDLGGPFVHSG